jgi:hypothetical protein
MIIKFKTFESLSIGAIERGEHLEMLKESLDEGVLSGITNFFSKMLGGGVSKLDKVLSKYKDNELDYWTDWADARSRMNKAEALSRESKDPVDKQKYEEQKERIKKLISQVESKRKDIADSIVKQANHIIKDSTRLRDYYEMKKTKIDEDVARESFDIVKKSTDDETIYDLFDNHINTAVKAAREKAGIFQRKYGNVDDKNSPFYKNTSDEESDELKVEGIKISDLMTKPLSDLQDRLKVMRADSLEDVLKFLEKESKKAKDRRDDEIKRIKNKSTSKEQQSAEIEDATQKANQVLDAIEKKTSYIDQLLLSVHNIGKEIKKNPAIVTDKTPEELGPKTTNTAINAAVATAAKSGSQDVAQVEDVIETKVDKNFEEAKGIIEESVGEEISEGDYKHLVNDLVALYGKLVFYYKKLGKSVGSKTLVIGLVDFAAELYKYKKKNDRLGKDLTDKELETLFQKYQK